MMNKSLDNEVVAEPMATGNVKFVPLVNLRNVTVYTRTAFEKLDEQGGVKDNLRCLFIRKNISNNSITAVPVEGRNDYHYVITAPSYLRSFIMLWLNSSLGIGELLGYDFYATKGIVTKKKLEHILLPFLENEMSYSCIGLIDDFAWMAADVEENINAESTRIENVASIFYSRVAEYAAMQLIVPSDFEKEDVDIIGAWSKLLKKEFNPEITIEDVSRVVNEAFRTNNDLMLNVNRMKLYNSLFYPRCVELLTKASEKMTLK